VSIAPPFDRRLLLWFLAAALGCALWVYLASLFAPRLAVPPLVAFALAFVSVTAEILLLSWCAPALKWRVSLPLVLVSVAALAPLQGAALPASGLAAGLLTLALGVACPLLGASLGTRIEQPGQLVAVALVSAIADLWSVFDPGAPSARFAEQALAAPEQLAIFALPFPLCGTPLVPAVIGAGDVVFTALYVAAFRAHRLAVPRLLLALALGYALGLLGLIVTMRPLPLLPLLGAAVIASEPAARSLHKREWRTVGVVCGALLLAVAVLRISR